MIAKSAVSKTSIIVDHIQDRNEDAYALSHNFWVNEEIDITKLESFKTNKRYIKTLIYNVRRKFKITKNQTKHVIGYLGAET